MVTVCINYVEITIIIVCLLEFENNLLQGIFYENTQLSVLL